MAASVTFKGTPVKLAGQLPAVGQAAPDFSATAVDLSTVKLSDFKGRTVIVAAVPSLDTGICDIETRRFNSEAANLGDVAILTVSADLPFAAKRWCGAAGVDKVKTLSTFRDASFAKAYGVTLAEGPLAGLLARAIVVVGKDGKVKYTELVPEIAQEPNYAAALAAAKA